MNLLYTLFAALAVIFTFFTNANAYTSGVTYAYDRHSRKSKRVDSSNSNSTYASAWTSDTPACFDGYTSCEFFGCIKGTKCPAICSQRTTINTCYFSANGKGCRWEENKCIQDIQCPIDDSGKCPDGCQGCGPYQCVVKGLTCPAPCDGRTQDSCSSETIVNGIGCSWTAGKCVLWDVFNLIPLTTDLVQAKEYAFELSDNSSSSSVSGSSDQTDTASSEQTNTTSSDQTDSASSDQTNTASTDQTNTTSSSTDVSEPSSDQTDTAGSSTDVSEPSSDEHGDGETKDGSKCDVEGDSTGDDDKTGSHGDGENTDDGDIVCDDEGESDKGSDDNKGDEDDLQCDDDEDSKDDDNDNKGGKDDDNKGSDDNKDDDDDEQCDDDDKSEDDDDVSEHSKPDKDDDNCDEDGDDSDDDDNGHGEKSDHDSDSDSEGDDKHTEDSHASGTKMSTSNKYTDINISTIYAITTANTASVSMSVSKSASSSSTSAKPTTSSSSEENSSSSQTMDGKSESKSIGLGPLIAIIFLAFGIVGLVSWGGLYYATRRKTEFNSSRAEVHQRSLANHDSSHDSGISTLNLSYSGPPVNNNAAQASTNPPRRDNHMSDLMQ